MKPSKIKDRSRATRLVLGGGLGAALALFVQCRAPEAEPEHGGTSAVVAAWDVVYQVLKHPRCVNCHPAGDTPLQGDASLPHGQNVQRGPLGQGVFALRCGDCHQTQNGPGPNLPPGAPHWQLPHPDMPLVFEGRSSGDLCRQLKDPARNGGRSPEELLQHMEADALVLWGWNPGEGRAPVSIPRPAFVSAVRAWVEGGCGCPQ